jgi:hypothetical protein
MTLTMDSTRISRLRASAVEVKRRERRGLPLRLQDSNPDLTAPKAVVLPLHQGGTHRGVLLHPPTTDEAGCPLRVRPRWRDAA